MTMRVVSEEAVSYSSLFNNPLIVSCSMKESELSHGKLFSTMDMDGRLFTQLMNSEYSSSKTIANSTPTNWAKNS